MCCDCPRATSKNIQTLKKKKRSLLRKKTTRTIRSRTHGSGRNVSALHNFRLPNERGTNKSSGTGREEGSKRTFCDRFHGLFKTLGWGQETPEGVALKEKDLNEAVSSIIPYQRITDKKSLTERKETHSRRTGTGKQKYPCLVIGVYNRR